MALSIHIVAVHLSQLKQHFFLSHFTSSVLRSIITEPYTEYTIRYTGRAAMMVESNCVLIAWSTVEIKL